MIPTRCFWLEAGHARAGPLTTIGSRLFVSPATLLELQFLVELQKIRLRNVHSVVALLDDDRWRLDEPPAGLRFEEAATLSWTRDPFDRLIVGHALARQWKLTADARILEHVDARRTVSL